MITGVPEPELDSEPTAAYEPAPSVLSVPMHVYTPPEEPPVNPAPVVPEPRLPEQPQVKAKALEWHRG